MRDDPRADPRRHPRPQPVAARDVDVRLRGPHLRHAGHHAADRRAGHRGARVGASSGAPGSCSSGRRRCPATGARARSACRSSTRSGRRWSRPTSSSPCTRPTAATSATPTTGWAATARCCRSSPRPSACCRPVAARRGRRVAPLICHGALSRFPALKMAVIENGSSWVAPLLANLADVYKKMPQDFLEDPVAVIQAQHPHQPVLGGGPRRAGRADRRRPGAVRVRLPAPRGAGRPGQLRRRAGRPARRGRPQDHGRQPRPPDERRGRGPVDEPRAAGRPSRRWRRDTAERFGDRLAVVDGDTRLTWAELHDEAQTFGAGLVASGVEPGDRVAIWAPNSAEWIVALLGLLQAGAVLVPVNTRFKGVEAADILARSRARVLVTVTDFLGTDYLAMLGGTGAPLPDLQTTVVAHGPAPAGAVAWDDVPGPGDRRHPRRRRRRAPRRSATATRRTSCSRRARRARRRASS